MKESTINALYYINTQGYDNSKWNIQRDTTFAGYYGDIEHKELPPHVAIYADDADDELYIKCHVEPDVILHVRDSDETILIYFL